MIKDIDKIKMALNLNKYEGDLLETIMILGLCTAGEIYKKSKAVPRSRIYDVAESLGRKGLIKSIPRKDKFPIKYKALTIEEIKTNSKKRILDEAHQKIKKIEEMLR